ncbi:MAG TPA: protein kinase [Polyangiaceae bacterium]|nr:protein kinase [Polyangiaceae bacterium]
MAEDGPAEPSRPAVLRARSRVGTTLGGKWHLDTLLGVGGMAAVYAATHRNGSRAAVKLLHPELSVEHLGRKRFLREGRAANAVGHHGTVKVLDDDISEDGSVFLILELLDGESLEERCVRFGGRLPVDEVLWIADQVLDVLAAAHRHKIVHRDLKPDNLFLTRSGSVKVLDFGIARFRDLSASATTQDGATMGTPAFMAPEQARGLWAEVDAQSDLFAIGATMFNLLSGRQVHQGRTANEQVVSAMGVPAPPLSSVVPGIADAVAFVVDRALAFEKAKRWSSARRMQEAVRRAYYDHNGRPITSAPKLAVSQTPVNRSADRSQAIPAPKQATTLLRVARTGLGQVWKRRTLIALAAAAGVVALVAIGIAIARPGHSSAAQSRGPSAPVPSVTFTPVAATTGKTIGTPSTPSEPPAVTVTSLPPAPTAPRATPKPPTAVTAPPAKSACSPPFVFDPSTHVKHWKLDCL